MKYEHHLIKNFSKQTLLREKVKGNVMFLAGITKVTRRKKYLKHKDYINSKKLLKKGDVVLVGTHRRISGIIISGVVTHSMMYIGNETLIHSIADGVEEMKYKDIFKEYDTLIILRPKNITSKSINKAIEFCKEQLGKPYDFNFDSQSDAFFCTELINKAYHQAGFKTGFNTRDKKRITKFLGTLRPIDFIKGNFDIMFLSHTLKQQKNKIVLNHEVYKNTWLEKAINR